MLDRRRRPPGRIQMPLVITIRICHQGVRVSRGLARAVFLVQRERHDQLMAAPSNAALVVVIAAFTAPLVASVLSVRMTCSFAQTALVLPEAAS